MKPITIVTILFTTVLSLQLVSFQVVSFVGKRHELEQAKELALFQVDRIAKSLAMQIQQFLAPLSSQLDLSRQLIGDGLLDTANNRMLESYFLSQLRSSRSVSGVFLGREDGSFISVSRHPAAHTKAYDLPVLRTLLVPAEDTQMPKRWKEYTLNGVLLSAWSEPDVQFDPRQYGWYRDARGHEQMVWTDIFSLYGADESAVGGSVSVRDHRSQHAGVLGMNVTLSALTTVIDSVPIREHTAVMLLDHDDNALALSSNDPVQGLALLSFSLVPPLAAAMPVFAGNGGPANDSVYSSAANDSVYSEGHWYSEDNQTLTIWRSLPLFDDSLHWRVMIQSSVRELPDRTDGSLMNDRSLSMMVMLAIIVPGALALLLIAILSSPLQTLHRRATIDFLTHALNREEFLNRFRARMLKLRHRGQRSRVKWVAVVLDLDGFKEINDRFGHDAGDMILKTVVQRLQRCVGRSDLVGRVGGDEFTLAIQVKTASAAYARVERIRQQVVREPIETSAGCHRIGMTAGLACVRDRESIDRALERADRALISGKMSGKNASYHCLSEVPDAEAITPQADEPNVQSLPGVSAMQLEPSCRDASAG